MNIILIRADWGICSLSALLFHHAFANRERDIATLCPHISLDFARTAKFFASLPIQTPRGGSGDNNGRYQVSIGNKKTESKNSRSGENMIMNVP